LGNYIIKIERKYTTMPDLIALPVTICKFFCAIKWKLLFASILYLLEITVGDIYSPMIMGIVILMTVDVITGVFFAWSVRSLSSHKMFTGIFVKCFVYGPIIIMLMVVAHQLTHVPEQLSFLLFSSLTYSMIFLTEVLSILENLWKISVCYDLEQFWWARGISVLLKRTMSKLLVSYGCETKAKMENKEK
jgi:toxin secretion/phage lysis holin